MQIQKRRTECVSLKMQCHLFCEPFQNCPFPPIYLRGKNKKLGHPNSIKRVQNIVRMTTPLILNQTLVGYVRLFCLLSDLKSGLSLLSVS